MNAKDSSQRITGIVLAAGKGHRFDPSGNRNKLLQPLPNGKTVAATTGANMRLVMNRVIAVIPDGDDRLAAEFLQGLCEVTRLPRSAQHMSESIVHAVNLTNDADGWIIALADMPLVSPDTYEKLLTALESGAGIAVPVFGGTRGNPVAFAKEHGIRLAQLSGDVGARSLLRFHSVVEVKVDDPGVCRDIDTEADYLSLTHAMRHAGEVIGKPRQI